MDPFDPDYPQPKHVYPESLPSKAPSSAPQPVYEPRKSLESTAYRLKYSHHVLQNEMDEVESALTEEETHHPNIQIMARILWELSIAQQNIAAAIKLLGDDITNTPS